MRLADVVSRTVELRQVGDNLVGRCPFHVETSTSFFVRPSADTFKCFGCWAQGDVIEFVTLIEHIDREQAVRALAAGAGVQSPTSSDR